MKVKMDKDTVRGADAVDKVKMGKSMPPKERDSVKMPGKMTAASLKGIGRAG